MYSHDVIKIVTAAISGMNIVELKVETNVECNGDTHVHIIALPVKE